jgi:hypothetical protein
MGAFYEQVEVVNRTSKILHCRFDGQDIELMPNYTDKGELIPDVHNMIPAIAAPYAKSQNVRMGSEDPLDPTDYEVLVGIKVNPNKKGVKQKDDLSYLEQSDELTRVNLADYLDDPSVKEIKVAGRRVKNSEARPERDTAPFAVRPR